jgi:hypothetical protein
MFIFSFIFVVGAIKIKDFFGIKNIDNFEAVKLGVILTSLTHVAIGIYGYTTMDKKKGLDNVLMFILSTLILIAPIIIFIYAVLNLH